MSDVISFFLFAVLSGVAALHLYWAFGGHWPARDEASLARTVVGVKDLRKMPGRGVTVIVSLLIALAGVLPLFLTGLLPNPFQTMVPVALQKVVATILMGGMALVFLGRGLLSYTGYFTNRNAEEPFVTLDRHYYAPLCLSLGAGYVLLVFLR